MIFRDKNGDLAEVKRKDFYNDSSYYKKIMELKGYNITQVNNNHHDSIFEKINGLIGRTITSK